MNYLCAFLISVSAFPACVLGGPDLICSEIQGAILFGENGKGINAYSFGTTLCNIGDEEIPWDANSNEHPLISQTLYKLKDHEIKQIGIGFVRHTTVPLAGDACGLGCSPAGNFALGVGCSDVSSAVINGSQGLMGPRSEVDPQSGFYPYPFTSINQVGDAVYKRLQVSQEDISDPDALYFVETQVISSSETTLEARNNNMSYRQVTFQSGTLAPTLVGPTYSEQPAIFAWRDHGNGIGNPDPDVIISVASIPDLDSTYVVGSHVEVLGEDHSLARYAVLNLNGEVGIRHLGIPNMSCSIGEAEIVSVDFGAPQYHDDLDDQIDSDPWRYNPVELFGYMHWNVDTFEDNANANAIRWGTMYNFSFEADGYVGLNNSEVDSVALLFFGPGQSVDVYTWIHAWAPVHCDPGICFVDLNQDLELDFFDIAFLFANRVDYNQDGDFDFFDISSFLTDFNIGCP
ncbi:MAG: hypothetical protein JJ974_08430 [Phycisphaerales bacterium]|nr:hypothetical protein [Phycisphaerales bacterium]